MRDRNLRPVDETREGYVPNVVYTCGALRIGPRIIMPYGIADSRVRCASFLISDLLATLS
jgi:predicted GH43/DUF377 family glycosyl hydrolase